MSIPTVIIEDEEKSVLVIKNLTQQFAMELELTGTAGSVGQSVELIERQSPQLIFLDVQIADGSGFDVLRKFADRSFEVIFITAHNQYAVEAFRFAATDYLLKPIGIPEFIEAVKRACTRIREKSGHQRIDVLLDNFLQQGRQDRKICIPTSGGHEFIDLKDIVWCGSEGCYTIFHLANNSKVISSRNLGSYAELLCANNFYRIHHTTIINLSFIKSCVKGKSPYVVMTNGAKLEISQRRKNDFLDYFMRT
jgi:two-component system LytT family response regulator